MTVPPHLIAGNWKMNGLSAAMAEIVAMAEAVVPAQRQLVLCPPFTLLCEAAQRCGARLALGGQDCSPHTGGAYTGDISAAMLADAGARYVILGHSERRHGHGERDELVRKKAEAAQTAGLTPIICVGELLEERKDAKAFDVVGRQLLGSLPAQRGYVVAYEPVWAIGTGLVPGLDDITAMHAFIAAHVRGEPILYGGSVKPGNAASILALPHVGGLLVGGASLKAGDFLHIARAGT